MCPQTFRSKIMSLEDNMNICEVFGKGRSPAPALNYLARRKASTVVSAGWQLFLPWVETTRQVADAVSRFIGPSRLVRGRPA